MVGALSLRVCLTFPSLSLLLPPPFPPPHIQVNHTYAKARQSADKMEQQSKVMGAVCYTMTWIAGCAVLAAGIAEVVIAAMYEGVGLCDSGV